MISGVLGAGYALAVRPVSAEAIRTPDNGLVVGQADIPCELGPLPAYFARPEGDGTFPVVLVVHEIFGVHEYIADVCRRLALEGYLAVAPDLYQRHGDVKQIADVRKIIDTVVARVPDAEVLADLDATLAWTKSDGQGEVSRAAVVGFCWGGRIVWLYAAHNPELRAGAAWYGRLVGAARPATPEHPIDLAGKRMAPVLGLYGADDSGIPLDTVEQMRAKLSAERNESEFVVFPAAAHGFHADYRPSYRPMAAAEGWRRMLSWFREHGAG